MIMPLSSALSETVIFGIGMPGVGELVLILLIVLVIFGAGKLPQIGDALGKSIRNFRKETKGSDEPDKPIETDRRLSEGSPQSVERVEEVEAHDVTPPKSKP